MKNKLLLKSFDYVMFTVMFILIAIGILFIFSGTRTIKTLESKFLQQIIFTILALILGFYLLFIDLKKLNDVSEILFIIEIAFLIITLLIGSRIRGSKSWIRIPGIGGIQPSEFGKLIYILFIAKFISLYQNDVKYRKSIRFFIILATITIIPVSLILLQPDFGSAFIYLLIFVSILIVADVNTEILLFSVTTGMISFIIPLYRSYLSLAQSSLLLKNIVFSNTYFFISFALLIIVASIMFFISFQIASRSMRIISVIIAAVAFSFLFGIAFDMVLEEYQKKRLLVFVDPDLDRLGAGYNIIQSKIAIGSGGLLGKGLFKGTQSQFGFLPERSTDFIFSIIAEEGGFVLSFLIIVLWSVIFIKLISIMVVVKNFYFKLVIAGVFGYLFSQTVLNIGMTIGLMPITGVPLPLISSGGSSLVTTVAALMVMINISMKKYSLLA